MATSVDQKLRAQTKFPPEFNQKVDMQKINVEVMKKWIAGRITEVLGSEDDIVIELCFNLLEGARFPDIKNLQISLTGFLDKDAATFCKDLWNLCLSAQTNPQGVPKELLEAKKLELMQEKVDAEKAVHDSRAKAEVEQARDAQMNDLRQRERASRGGDRGGDRGRGRGRGRGGRGGYDSPRYRDASRSPRRRSPYRNGPANRREIDTYVPGRGGRGQERNGRGRPRSRSSSRSLSRSPPRRGRGISQDESPSRSRSRSPARRQAKSPVEQGSKEQKNRRSASKSDESRSRSPKRRRRYSLPSRSRSRSRSPPRRRQNQRSPSSSMSRSRSRSRDRYRGRGSGGRRGGGRYRSRSRSRDGRRNYGRGDIVRGRPARDERRLSRGSSADRDQSKSRSRSRSRRRGNKRNRSLRRWDAPHRRRRNTSSVSSTRSPEQKRARRDSSPVAADAKNGDAVNGSGGDE